MLPHPPHQNVRGGRAQLSDNPLHPIFVEWGKENGVVRRVQLKAVTPQHKAVGGPFPFNDFAVNDANILLGALTR